MRDKRSSRLIQLALAALIVLGCISIQTAPDTSPRATTPRQPTPSTAQATNPSSTRESGESPASRGEAGPPFPARTGNGTVFDFADVFRDATERRAAGLVGQIAAGAGLKVIVFTQFKAEATTRSTEQDASALIGEWAVNDGLVIFWNITRPECDVGLQGNGHVQLLTGLEAPATMPSPDDLQIIFDEVMLPSLTDCDEDEALIGALEAIKDGPEALPTPLETPPGGESAACKDPTYRLFGHRWDRPYEWRFQSSGTPDPLDPTDVLAVLERSAANITDANNDCGLADNVSATAEHLGDTDNEPCANEVLDGENVVGFGKLPGYVGENTLAFVCPMGEDESLEIDILISKDVRWALDEDSCRLDQELLEASITHEFGHVFGLAHVGERNHGELTMSPLANGFCDLGEITLGWGDVLGLEELY